MENNTNLDETYGRSVSDLNEALGRESEELESLAKWINGIPEGFGYREFKIRKRNGRNFREISAPNDKLMRLQKQVYENLLRNEAVQSAAHGFVPDRSIVTNALPHKDSNVVINVDLKDFFPSVKAQKVFNYWKGMGWGEQASTILGNICCFNGQLPQGAPTSPALSNVVNRYLDGRLEGLALKFGGKYTRYADDITFSFKGNFGRKQRKIIPELRRILSQDGYEIQRKKKIRVQRNHQRQTVTGLTVNEDVRLPRALRKKIRAIRYLGENGRLSRQDKMRLSGYLAYENMVESAREVRKQKVLFLLSSPINAPALRQGVEFKEIQNIIEAQEHKKKLKLEIRTAVSIDEVLPAILKVKPQIIHFSGHGMPNGELCFESSSGYIQPVNPEAIRGLFKQFTGKIKCVLLNACYSDVQAEAIAKHIDFVIGMKQEVDDTAAIAFAKGFYTAFADGKKISKAFEFGCNQIDLLNMPGTENPVIFKRNQ